MQLDHNDELTATNVHCCIGVNCYYQPYMPLCSSFTEDSYLETLPYEDVVGVFVDDDVLTTHTEENVATGLAYIKDKCNQLGDNCLGVSVVSNGGDNTFRTHGQQATLTKNNQLPQFHMKAVNFVQEGFAFVEGLQARQNTDSVFSCYLLCLQTRFCKDFFFNINSRQCYVQDRLFCPLQSHRPIH